MRFWLATLLMTFTLTVQAKVMSKANVRTHFILGAQQCTNCILSNYDLEYSSVDVSLPDNIFTNIEEFGISIWDDSDIYEIHADYYKNGDRYHLNYYAIVTYLGKKPDGHHYSLRTRGTSASSFWAAEDNATEPAMTGKITFTRKWVEEKVLW